MIGQPKGKSLLVMGSSDEWPIVVLPNPLTLHYIAKDCQNRYLVFKKNDFDQNE